GGGDIESAHAVFLLDAALECGDPEVLRRVCNYLSVSVEDRQSCLSSSGQTRLPLLHAYPLAHDCAATLKAYAVAKRWRTRFPSVDVDRFVASVNDNRLSGPRLDDFSFA